MDTNHYDIVIIGSGMAGLYSAYNIKKLSPKTSFVVLEKYKREWIGGRTSNEMFYGTEIVTGAGIGRKNKDKLLLKLLHDLNFPTTEYTVDPQYSQLINPINIVDVMKHLKKEYKNFTDKQLTFKQFTIKILGKKDYHDFVISTGYSDYENSDIFETLYYYGLEDNKCCWKAFHVPWKKMFDRLFHFIGEKNFKFSNNVIQISKIENEVCKFVKRAQLKNQFIKNIYV